MRSLVPDNVHIVALTATVTVESFSTIAERLSLKSPALVGIRPNQPNIKYFVESLPSLEILCDTLSSGLQNLRLNFPKTLVFCRSLGDCSAMYQAIRKKLAKDFTEPSGYPDLHCFRLVDMFTRASKQEMKEKVLISFIKANGKLRLVIATTAFSMGIDCPDIRNVIHFGPPATIEQYIQETGRAGRDGESSTALLLYGGTIGKHIEKKVQTYGKNTTTCRRELVLKDFLFYDKKFGQEANHCCDICDKIQPQ